MKERNILPLILTMSLPMVISMAVNALYNIVDSYFVAKISDQAMTALSLVFPMQNLINAIAIGFGVGVNAAIAFYLGAKKQSAANSSAVLGIGLSILHGIILTAVCIFVMPSFLGIFTTNENILALALQYANRAFLFSAVIHAGICLEKVFQAVGNMNISMFCMICGCVTNIILDPVMIFGIGPFPAMGIRGAAYATGIGQCVTLLLYILFLVIRPVPLTLHPRYLKAESYITKRLYQVGIPASLNTALPSVQISVLNQILGVFNEQYVLVLGIYYKLQTFIYLTANGMIQGIRPIVSFNYGAKEMKRVVQVLKTSLCLIIGIMFAGTIISWAFPQQIFSLFATEPSVIESGSHALRIISLGFVVSAVSVTCSGVLEGLGKGTSSLLISLARYILLMLPFAFLFSRISGANGVWYAFVMTEFITAAVSLGIWFHTKKHSLRQELQDA